MLALLPSSAFAVSVKHLHELSSSALIDCSQIHEHDAQRVRIEAPAAGWPVWGVAVLVLDASPGLVSVRVGTELRCGYSSDARGRDARFHSGVGATFYPAAGSRAPIEVTVPSKRWLNYSLTIHYGDPVLVQREDTLRFAIRVGGFGVLIAMLLSSMLLFTSQREPASMLFAATIAVFTFWIGLRTGLSAWPQPWLPTITSIKGALLLLPLLGLAGMWSAAIIHARAKRSFPWIAATHLPVAAAALLISVAWILWPEGRDLLFPALRGIAFAIFFSLLVLMLLLLRRGHRNVFAVLIAIIPAVLLMGPLYDEWLRAWRAEAMLLGGAWFAVTMAAAMSQRIGSLRRQRDRLRVLSERDALTGLPNRRALNDALAQCIDEAQAKRRPLSLVFVDFDRFKFINDRHGHAVGDEVLVEAARRLSCNLRDGGIVARHGGEEFVLLLPGATPQQAFAAAERLREGIASAPFVTTAGSIAVTASFGVVGVDMAATRYPPAASVLLARADAAMYAAKKAGRNRVELATD